MLTYIVDVLLLFFLFCLKLFLPGPLFDWPAKFWRSQSLDCSGWVHVSNFIWDLGQNDMGHWNCNV